MKNKRTLLWIILIFTGIFIMSCEKSLPSQMDGSLGVTFKVGYMDVLGNYQVVPHTEVMLTSTNYGNSFYAETDANGVVHFDSLYASSFSAFINFEAGIDSSTTARYVFSKKINISVSTPDTMSINLEPAVNSLIIHEFYYCGLRNDSVRIYSDQFVELYNPTSEIQYLDGLVIGKGYKTEEDGSSEYVTVSYAYKFPGEPGEKNYPVNPYQVVLIARNALDYGELIAEDVNLENADWETVSAVASEGDSDNPEVPNLVPVNDYATYQKDVKFSLTSGILLLFPYSQFEEEGKYLKVPVKDILDGLEYNRSEVTEKKLSDQVDSGIGGIGVSLYSGHSIQRKEPWLDTNNSTNDFEILSVPSPGTL